MDLAHDIYYQRALRRVGNTPSDVKATPSSEDLTLAVVSKQAAADARARTQGKDIETARDQLAEKKAFGEASLAESARRFDTGLAESSRQSGASLAEKGRQFGESLAERTRQADISRDTRGEMFERQYAQDLGQFRELLSEDARRFDTRLDELRRQATGELTEKGRRFDVSQKQELEQKTGSLAEQRREKEETLSYLDYKTDMILDEKQRELDAIMSFKHDVLDFQKGQDTLATGISLANIGLEGVSGYVKAKQAGKVAEASERRMTALEEMVKNQKRWNTDILGLYEKYGDLL